MSNFTRDDVRHLARLARLELSEDDLAVFTRQLGDILAFVRQVESVETAGLEPDAAESIAAAPPRDDEVRASLDRADVLAGAPESDPASGLFKVPRVING